MRSIILCLTLLSAAGKTVMLATFDGAKGTTLPFTVINDPVMGGKSHSTFVVSKDKGIFEGEVKVVPFLGSPGFCNLEAPGFRHSPITFPDISGTDGLSVVMSQTLASGLTHWGLSMQTKTSTKAAQGAGWQASFEFKAGQTTYFVPYTAFKCSSRGRPLKNCGKLSEQLDELTQIGIGSSGVAGPFRVELTSLAAESAASTPFAETEVKLATFDGAKGSSLKWRMLLDPVMGGASTGKFSITANGTALFKGSCKIVEKLAAPGFANIEGTTSGKLADVTGTSSLLLKLRSSTPEYQGFKIGFGAPGIPSGSIFEREGSYKSEFNLTKTTDWQVVEVPISHFSRDTSGFTGRCDTKDPRNGKQHYCCPGSGFAPSKPEVCVESKYLSSINGLQIWAEGVEGKYDLEIEWIGAKPSVVLV